MPESSTTSFNIILPSAFRAIDACSETNPVSVKLSALATSSSATRCRRTLSPITYLGIALSISIDKDSFFCDARARFNLIT